MMMWDNERTINFIKEFEKHPVLWKKSDKCYHNVDKKERAWQEIGEMFDEEVAILKRKIDSLRGSRRREKHRMLKRQRTGNPADAYVTRWFAWDSLKFLDQREEQHASNIPEEMTIKEEMIDIDEATIDSFRNDSDHVTEAQPIMSNNKWIPPEKRYVPTKQLRKRKRPRYSKSKDELGTDAGDECSLFGAYIAEKLRKCDDRTRVTLQHEIHTLLFQNEIKTQQAPPEMQCPDSSDSDHSFASSSVPASPTYENSVL